MLQANAKANEILTSAQKTAAERSEKIIGEAQQAAADAVAGAQASDTEFNAAMNEVWTPSEG